MPNTVDDLSRIATDLTRATQTVTLSLLAAEMQALAHLMPGAMPTPAPLPDDEEVEQGFENMPV